MRQMVTQISTAETSLTTNRARDVFTAAKRNLDMVRSKSSPELAVVSNFDPDQRGFITDAMKGFVMLQKQTGDGSVGELSIFADYGRVAPVPGQTASQANSPKAPGVPTGTTWGDTNNPSGINNNKLRPVPGQPQVIYPVASGSTSVSLSFIRGGKVDYVRIYPARLMIRNHRSFTRSESSGDIGESLYSPENTVVIHNTATFFRLDYFNSWSENSPLPPGMRYIEFNDMRWATFTQFGVPSLSGRTINDFVMPPLTSEGDTFFTDYDTLLPHAYWNPVTESSSVKIRRNIKPLPDDAWFNLNEVYTDDSYWTGDAADPLNWVDSYWDGLDLDPTGNTPRVDRAALAAWLKDHPKALLKE